MRQERLDKYELVKELGSGISSKVKLGFHSETGESAALKILTNFTSQAHRNSFKNEVSILRDLDHPNLINIKRYYDEVTLEEGNRSNKKVAAIALEYASNGDMCQYMETSGRFSENVARYYFRQIIEALEYCHQRGIMHRDIKPENVLFDENFNLKIADFGFAKFLNDRGGKLSLHTALGTDGYMAPEMHTGRPYEGKGVDLFAAGVVLFLMIVGHPPFGRADPRDSFYKVITKQREDLFWKYHEQCMDCKEEDRETLISEDLKTLISPMLALDPNERLTIKEIKEHVWYDGPLPTREEILKEMCEKRSRLASAADLAPQDSIQSVEPIPESVEEQKDASDAP